MYIHTIMSSRDYPILTGYISIYIYIYTHIIYIYIHIHISPLYIPDYPPFL